MKTTFPVTRRRRSRQRGSAMLEIALSFTAFLLLTFGVMDFAMAVYAFNFCSSASGEAARWASVRGAQYSNSVSPPLPALTEQDVKNHVLTQMVALDASKLSVTVPAYDHNPGGIVQVTVAYTVVPLTWLGLTDNIQVHNTSQTIIMY